MFNNRIAVSIGLLLLLQPVRTVLGDGAPAPRLGGEMKHLFIDVDSFTSTVHVTIQGDAQERVQLLHYDEMYAPPADVLNDKGYSGRYGWLAAGFIVLDPGQFIWVRVVAQTPGLMVYEEGSFAPILSQPGETWRWSGSMAHNWYAVAADGDYDAVYEVYVGDAQGMPIDGFTADTVALHWQAQGLPTPSVPLGIPPSLLGMLMAASGAYILQRASRRIKE